MTTREIIFIPYNTPSLKNSKIKTARGIFHSKTVTKYLRALGIQAYSPSKKYVKGYKRRPNEFADIFDEVNWDKPTETIILGFHFVRNSKRKFDFQNANQIVLDLMTAHDLIEDDNMDWVIPIPFKMNDKWYSHDKINPGVYLTIFNINELKDGTWLEYLED